MPAQKDGRGEEGEEEKDCKTQKLPFSCRVSSLKTLFKAPFQVHLLG